MAERHEVDLRENGSAEILRERDGDRLGDYVVEAPATVRKLLLDTRLRYDVVDTRFVDGGGQLATIEVIEE